MRLTLLSVGVLLLLAAACCHAACTSSSCPRATPVCYQNSCVTAANAPCNTFTGGTKCGSGMVCSGGVCKFKSPPSSPVPDCTGGCGSGFRCSNGICVTSTTTTTKTSTSSVDGCFAASSRVRMVSRRAECVRLSISSDSVPAPSCVDHVPVSELRLGDWIESVEENGQRTFEPVIDLSHTENDKSFVDLRTITLRSFDATHTAQSLALTADHMLYVQRAGEQPHTAPHLRFQQAGLLAAREVRVGDSIAVLRNSSHLGSSSTGSAVTTMWLSVVAVSSEEVIGVRNVWTRSGRLLVEDMVVSPFREEVYQTYAQIQQGIQIVLGWCTSQFSSSAEAASPTLLHAVVHATYMSAIQLWTGVWSVQCGTAAVVMRVTGALLAVSLPIIHVSSGFTRRV